MRKRIESLFCIQMLLLLAILPVCTLAGDPENPEIEDNSETDVFPYLDVLSAWFFEKEEEPGFLYTSMKLVQINSNRLKQHLTIHWEHKGVECAAAMFIGYGDPWFAFEAGYGHGFWFQEHYVTVSGVYNVTTGIYTCKIPKEIINNPQKGDVLTSTYALTFQRFGFIGRLGFDRIFLPSFIFMLSHKQIHDRGPDTAYGKEYTIQF